jgi:hypothetical protein
MEGGGGETFFQCLESLYCAKQFKFANDHKFFTYFNLKLDKTQNKTGGVISQIDSGITSVLAHRGIKLKKSSKEAF